MTITLQTIALPAIDKTPGNYSVFVNEYDDRGKLVVTCLVVKHGKHIDYDLIHATLGWAQPGDVLDYGGGGFSL